MLRLAQVAEVRFDLGPSMIRREDVERVAMITGPDLAVDLDDRGVLTAPGQSFVNAVTVMNRGNQDRGSGVSLAVELDPHTAFSAAGSSPAWSCAGSTCSRVLPALGAGAAAVTFDLEVTVASPLPAGVTELVATATVAAPGDLDPTNDSTSTRPGRPSPGRASIRRGCGRSGGC